MPTKDALAVAKRFATALDRCDLAEAGLCLASDCHYEIGTQQLIGPDAILASYCENAEWAGRALEQVIYESAVEEGQEGLSVLYTDRIVHRGLTHQYSSRQHLTINDDGQITRIVHEELPGQREKLDEFLSQCGVRRW